MGTRRTGREGVLESGGAGALKGQMLLSNVCVTKAELTGFVKAFLSRGESPSPGDQSRCSVSPQRKTESLTTVACPHTAFYHTTQ